MSGFEPAADSYSVPQYSPSDITQVSDLSSLLDLLFRQNNEPYGVYWRNPRSGGEVLAGMAFFTCDGGLIVGLTVHEGAAEKYLAVMKDTLQSRFGTILFEQPPPESSKEFLTWCS